MLLRSADDKMKYYENLAEMYVGDDVSPDFYGWVFPKYDHVAVGTGKAQHCRAAVAAAGMLVYFTRKLLAAAHSACSAHPRPSRHNLCGCTCTLWRDVQVLW